MTRRRASCVATVTSRGYELGTAVLLSSLAARNPTLDATLVVLHDGLGARASRLLSAIPGVELVRVGEALSECLDAVRARQGFGPSRHDPVAGQAGELDVRQDHFAAAGDVDVDVGAHLADGVVRPRIQHDAVALRQGEVGDQVDARPG